MQREAIVASAAGRNLDRQDELNVEGHSTSLTHFSWEAFLQTAGRGHGRAGDMYRPGTRAGSNMSQRSRGLCDEPCEEGGEEGQRWPRGAGVWGVGAVVSALGLVLRAELCEVAHSLAASPRGLRGADAATAPVLFLLLKGVDGVPLKEHSA